MSKYIDENEEELNKINKDRVNLDFDLNDAPNDLIDESPKYGETEDTLGNKSKQPTNIENNTTDWLTYNVKSNEKSKNKVGTHLIIAVSVSILAGCAFMGVIFSKNLANSLTPIDSSSDEVFSSSVSTVLNSSSEISESLDQIVKESISQEITSATSEVSSVIESSEPYNPETYVRVISEETTKQQVSEVNKMLAENPVMTEESPDEKTLNRIKEPIESRDWVLVYLTGGQFVWWVKTVLATYEGVNSVYVFPEDNKVTLYGDIESLKLYTDEISKMFSHCDLGLDNDKLTLEIIQN